MDFTVHVRRRNLSHREQDSIQNERAVFVDPVLISRGPRGLAQNAALSYRVCHSLIILDLRTSPIGPTKDRAATELNLARAFTTLLTYTLQGLSQRQQYTPSYPTHVRFVVEAVQHSDIPGEPPFQFFSSIGMTVTDPAHLHETIRQQIASRYSDDGYLDELGSDHDNQAQTYVVRVELELMLQTGALGQGGCRTTCTKERWETSTAEDGRFFRLMDPKSDNNNCGIACLLHYAKANGCAKAMGVRRHNDVRLALGIPIEIPLTGDHLDQVAMYFEINYTLLKISGERSRYCQGYPSNLGLHANILTHDNHYTLILNTVGRCPCGKPDAASHVCIHKGGFCELCHVQHANAAHDCPYSTQAIANREVQEMALLDQRRAVEERRQLERRKLDEHVDVMENSADFAPILDCIFSLKRHCLVIGPGGVGKTTVCIKEVISLLADLGGKARILCPTGQAATLHEDASTIHYALKIRPGDRDLQVILRRFKPDDIAAIMELTHLLLDEISMIEASLITLVDNILRSIRSNVLPFGGLQLCGCGDFMQLTPINSSHMFFDAEVIRTLLAADEIGVYYLTKPLRYPDTRWFDLLCRVRLGRPTSTDLGLLNTRLKTLEEWKAQMSWTYQTMPVLATPRNKEADKFNDECLEMLRADGKDEHTFERRIKTLGESIERREIDKLVSERVTLLIDCKVMLLINTTATRNYLEHDGIGNGSVGWVRAFTSSDGAVVDEVLVEFENGAEVSIGFHCVDRIASQIPLRVCYACTVHKLQGATLLQALLDLSRCFCPQQAYTALSRVVKMQNVYLIGLNSNHLKWVDPRCMAFSCARTKKPLPRLEVDDEGAWCDPGVEQPYMRAKIINRGRHKREDKTGIKTIFFDAETYHGPDGMLEVYHMEALKVTHHRVFHHSWTKLNEESDVMKDFAEFITDQIKHDVRDFERPIVWSAAKNYLKRPFVLAAYNGANFDFHLLIKYMFLEGHLNGDYKVSMLMRGNAIAYFDIKHLPTGKTCVVLHDLCRILMCSLSKASQDMLGLDLKGIFPHLHMNTHGYRALAPDAQPREVLRGEFFAKDHSSLDKLHDNPDAAVEAFPSLVDIRFDAANKFKSVTFDLPSMLQHYGRLDVDIMRALYKKMDSVVATTFNASVLDFFSSNQMSRYGALINLPRDARLTKMGGHGNYIESKLFKLTAEQDLWVVDALYGGRTLPRQTHFRSSHLDAAAPLKITLDLRVDWLPAPYAHNSPYEGVDALLFVDIFSMYVSIMKDSPFPYGKPRFLLDSEVTTWLSRLMGHRFCQGYSPFDEATLQLATDLIDGKHGYAILDVDLACHPCDVEPPVPYRENGKVFWDSKRRRGKYTTIDIGLCLRNGGVVYHVYGGIVWPFSGRIFEKYMEQTLAWKNQGEVDGNEALRSFGKLCGNTVFGGMCMKTQSSAVAVCSEDSDLELFLKENTWEGAYMYPDSIMVWGKRKSVDEEGSPIPTFSPTAKQVGVFVLAYARLQVDTFASAANPYRARYMKSDVAPGPDVVSRLQTMALMNQPFYGDTDSLIVHARNYPHMCHLLGDAPGKWTDDLNKKWEVIINDPQSEGDGRTIHAFSLIFEYYGPAPKSYALSYVVPKTSKDSTNTLTLLYPMTSLKEKCRFKGVPGGVAIRVDDKIFEGISLELIKLLMQAQLTELDRPSDAELSEDTPELKLPTISITSIGKVGYKPTTSDYFAGIAPFSLKPVFIKRTLFASVFRGRKIAFRTTMPGSLVLNSVLAPLNFPQVGAFTANTIVTILDVV